MITADEFLRPCLDRGFNFFTGTPCSYLKPIINYVIDHEEYRFVDAVNEGDAVAMASGFTIGGGRAVVMFQNSGLGNAVNPLTSLAYTFRIPLLVIVTLRGEPGGEKDEPQHELMGLITTRLLDTMQIKWSYFPDENRKVADLLDRAEEYFDAESRPYALVMRKKDVDRYDLVKKSQPGKFEFHVNHRDQFLLPCESRHSRKEALREIQSAAGKETIVVASTGYNGRELHDLEDRENQFYMVGSMGCAAALGFGLSLARHERRIIVVDGDGALLMRTGNLATVGFHQPQNLIHVLLDNEAHDSTGGQLTVSRGISFAAAAKAFGYKHVISTDRLVVFREVMNSRLLDQGPVFVHFKIRKGATGELGRPHLQPFQVKERLMMFLGQKAEVVA
ncbi:MAG: phosphonopyruvate decarboxylase [Ignavibacteriales bacterium]|nr:phosphonopyruvate decarboxylase [Ignavibacteriales bacterium]